MAIEFTGSGHFVYPKDDQQAYDAARWRKLEKLIEWSKSDEGADTEWSVGYEAARRYVAMQLNAAMQAKV